MFFLPTTYYLLPVGDERPKGLASRRRSPLPICEAYAKALAARRPLGLPT
jgi:hypothetical protein